MSVPRVDSSSKLAQVVMTALDHGISSHAAKSNLLIDSRVNKTLLSEKDWQQIRPHHIPRKPKLKKNKTNFTPFGTKIRLLILRRTKCQFIAECGRQITTIVYILAGETQSLSGLADSKALGIIQIIPEGKLLVRQLTEVNKACADAEAIISGNQT